ncbi:NAD(P)-dependent dehydrogenase, short-chain alcohol dehydrogenase family [Bacteroides faecichinchillae]|uniref:NAD(P)-dependent dehydrogenase, short-chain alcohol dehydrogenase family n=1 Tax=Bacteroides faecichinchillae TaxID=871325 RepID=A0A1M5G1R8_9BACE|nr:SDR family oxidoreductase [Bacteroides faecichinchillae]THG64041.1 SDR family oxidoreductase [Bacteroides faecichinchillae]SHF97659.1 NAD(P)-dependent dehydrogenase, short-chain alcohol dehydrogenase family [Bacteroides faecichinchillae]
MSEIFNPFSLQGKTILVTGASSGIGKSVAISCAKMGATVVITARNEERLKATLAEMPKGGTYIKADLINQNEVEHLVKELPRLDGLVQCAGVGSRVLCKHINKENIEEVMLPNFQAPVLLQSLLLIGKKINKSASIIYIASRAASAPSIGNALYSASKGAILSYAKCLALELAPRLIRVNCICPGMVWTDLILQNGVEEEVLREAEHAYPLQRFGNVYDISNLAIYLLSDASSWMTGSAIDISGGGEGILKL